MAGVDRDSLSFRLHFDALTVAVGRAGPNWLAWANPDDRETSLLGAALPDTWRAECWYFCPDAKEAGRPRDEFWRGLALLIDLLGAQRIFWSPARLWSDAGEFRSTVAAMQASGMPPVLHLVAFRHRDGPGGARVATRGLAALAGQELEAAVPEGWDMAAIATRLARLAADMMLSGPVLQPRQAPGLTSGEWVALRPQRGIGGAPGTVLVELRFDR